jgi:hypothetical protein
VTDRTHAADRDKVLADCRELSDDHKIELDAAWVADLILDAEQDDADWWTVANRLRPWCNVAGTGDLANALAIAERHINKTGGEVHIEIGSSVEDCWLADAEIARLTKELAEARAETYRERMMNAGMVAIQRADDIAKAREAREACAKILDAAGDAEGALFLGASGRGDHIRSIMFNSAANAFRTGAAAIRARLTERKTPEQAKPPFPREWDDPK